MNLRGNRGLSSVSLVVSVLVVAANLRAAITMVGPLIEQIGTDTGTSPMLLGLLGSIPVFSFAVVSPLVSTAASRWGLDRTIFFALFLLAVGTAIRSLVGLQVGLPAELPLMTGTVILSVAIGVCNVLVPAVVKQDFPDRVPQMTGLYTAVMSGCSALAAAGAVPLAGWLGWELALSVTAVIALISAGLWAVRLRHQNPGEIAEPRRVPRPAKHTGLPIVALESVWSSLVAWQLTLYFGLQSAIFYTMLTWFPAIQTSVGIGEAAAGGWLAIYQAIGILGSLIIGQVMQRARDHRVVAFGLGVIMAAGLLGMVVLPTLMPIWALISGFASGAALLAALTLISLRAPTPEQAGRLSGMAQGAGYLLASAGPVLAGALYQLTGNWTHVLVAAAAAALTQSLVGLLAGRNRNLR